MKAQAFIQPNDIPSSIRISIEQRVAQLIVRKRLARDHKQSRAFREATHKKPKRCLKCRNILSFYDQRDGAHLCAICNAENAAMGRIAYKLPPSCRLNQKITPEERI